MLDMGFETDIRKLVEQLGMPAKDQRQTLMFSATFPEEIQKLAADFLNDYLFVTVGRVGAANTDITQNVFQVTQFEKRDKLVSILNEAGKKCCCCLLVFSSAFCCQARVHNHNCAMLIQLLLVYQLLQKHHFLIVISATCEASVQRAATAVMAASIYYHRFPCTNNVCSQLPTVGPFQDRHVFIVIVLCL